MKRSRTAAPPLQAIRSRVPPNEESAAASDVRNTSASAGPSVSTSRLPRILLLNLASLSLLGSGVSIWLLLCSDWFPIIGGLLGLGSAFAWLAFVVGLLKEERKKELQNEIEQLILLRPYTWKAVCGLALLFGLVISMFGTLELRSIGAEEQRVLQIRNTGALVRAPDDEYAWVLSPFERSRKLVFTGWWPGRRYRVRIEGLPQQTFEVAPLVRTRVTVPSSFAKRTVVLLRSNPRITLNAGDVNRTYDLAVTLDRKVIALVPTYRGRTLWIGCHADVKLPISLVDQWRDAVEDPPVAWFSPSSVAEETIFKSGQTLEAWLLHEGKGLRLGSSVSSPQFRPENIYALGSLPIPSGKSHVLEILLKPST